jgi:hypothetical protein
LIASGIEKSLLKVLGRDQVLRLEVKVDSGDFVDLGQTWLKERLQASMEVENILLSALDNTLRTLFAFLPLLATDSTSGSHDKVRELILWLLAVRHEYLDLHIYSQCAQLEPLVMQKVKVLVLSASMLNKLNAGMSSWCEWFAACRRFIP